MKLSLTDRLARYCRNNPGWIASGHLQRLALEKGYTAQNAGRRLRELVEDGVLEVEYRKPRNHAYYRACTMRTTEVQCSTYGKERSNEEHKRNEVRTASGSTLSLFQE